ncbi:MAG: hypothetical protein HKM24_04485 [Gammaproteobacteria bacterium]|nr:hypothetical protein [Gammaproteobacteria bacterium]
MIHVVDRPIRWQLRSQSVIADAAIEMSEWDLLEANPMAAPVSEWIEDELIASLPLVARHDSLSACNPAIGQWLNQQTPLPSSETQQPFAELGEQWQQQKRAS